MKRYSVIITLLGMFFVSALPAGALTLDQVTQKMKAFEREQAQVPSVLGAFSDGSVRPVDNKSNPKGLPAEKAQIIIENLRNVSGEHIPSILVKPVKFGMTRSDEVKKLQIFLKVKGYLDAEPNGNFGMQTKKALKNFQSSEGINGDGSFVGVKTSEAIAEAK